MCLWFSLTCMDDILIANHTFAECRIFPCLSINSRRFSTTHIFQLFIFVLHIGELLVQTFSVFPFFLEVIFVSF